MALTYPERRAQAIVLAANADGYARPPRPEGNSHIWPVRTMPAWQCLRILGPAKTPKPDRYGFVQVKDDFRLMAYFEAKEKNQNREKFD